MHSITSHIMSKGQHPTLTHVSLVHTPLHRWLEAIAVLGHCSSIIIMPWFYFFLWTFPFLWPLLIAYTFYLLIDKSLINGSNINRRSNRLRSLDFYKHFCNYFPIRIHKTCDLEPTFTIVRTKKLQYSGIWNYVPRILTTILERIGIIHKSLITVNKEVRKGPTYVFGCHPHGVISFGITGAFATQGISTSTLFPGIHIFLLTISLQFLIPFFREYLMAMGIGLVTKLGIMSLLKQGQSVAIVVGGASESLLSRPGSNSLILNKRKGFIKMAIRMVGQCQLGSTDICLVPVYSFGETNVYKVFSTANPRESKTGIIHALKSTIRHVQYMIKEHLGFTVPIFWCQGLFNYDFGFLPRRKPVDVVFGKPIRVKRLYGNRPGDPVTDDEIAYYHRKYIQCLRQLFDENKAIYLHDNDADLTIVQ